MSKTTPIHFLPISSDKTLLSSNEFEWKEVNFKDTQDLTAEEDNQTRKFILDLQKEKL